MIKNLRRMRSQWLVAIVHKAQCNHKGWFCLFPWVFSSLSEVLCSHCLFHQPNTPDLPNMTFLPLERQICTRVFYAFVMLRKRKLQFHVRFVWLTHWPSYLIMPVVLFTMRYSGMFIYIWYLAYSPHQCAILYEAKQLNSVHQLFNINNFAIYVRLPLSRNMTTRAFYSPTFRKLCLPICKIISKRLDRFRSKLVNYFEIYLWLIE
jgi:hypothetical protein